MGSDFDLACAGCGSTFGHLGQWIYGQRACRACGSGYPYIRYEDRGERISRVAMRARSREMLEDDWLSPVLPIGERTSLLPSPRGFAGVESWRFLEELALRHGVRCSVNAHRFDNIPATGTVKDLAGHLIATVTREHGVRSAVVASTGNIAVALSRFLAEAGIHLFAFLPKGTSPLNVSEIACYGQTAYVVDGDYAEAKSVAAKAAQDSDCYFSPNGWDPIRIEAKKTIAYEWYRQTPQIPSVYIQALSGGMGPIGIERGLGELRDCGLVNRRTRFLLAQTDGCNPMAQAWRNAEANRFPENWERDYPVINDPETIVNTISTGDPRLYPVVAPIVRDSGGRIFDVPERTLHDVAYQIARRAYVRVGPSSAVAVTGFLKALKNGWIEDGDDVVVAIGEGARRSPEFFTDVADGVRLRSGEIPPLQVDTIDERQSLDAIITNL